MLASYLVNNSAAKPLDEWLDAEVFTGYQGTVIMASPEEVAGFDRYLETYLKKLPVEEKAVEVR